MSTTIVRGVPAGAGPRAAALYREAFAAELRPALGDGPRARALLEATLHPDRMLCAVQPDGLVVGVLGFHHDGRGAFGVRHRDLAAAYSPASAWLRLLLLAPLERRARPGELLLDGVCVAAEARGRGTGTALLAAADDVARAAGATAVRLSVVDANPRARALYERLGFVAGRTVRAGGLGALYGFDAVTEMVRPVAPAPAPAPARAQGSAPAPGAVA